MVPETALSLPSCKLLESGPRKRLCPFQLLRALSMPLAHVRRAAMMCARRVCATRFLAFEVATSDPSEGFYSGSPAEARVRPQYFEYLCIFRIFRIAFGTMGTQLA